MQDQVSNCCGADFLGEVSNGVGICGECKEWAGVMEEDEVDPFGMKVAFDNLMSEADEIIEKYCQDTEGNETIFMTPEYMDYLQRQENLASNLMNRSVEDFQKLIVDVKDMSWTKFWNSWHESQTWDREYASIDQATEYVLETIEDLQSDLSLDDMEYGTI